MTAPVRSAREVVEELLVDNVIRHEVRGTRTLTRAQAVRCIADTWKMFATLLPDLNRVVVGDDGEHVAIAYRTTMTLKGDSKNSIGSIEISHVIDGRIVEVYNCRHPQGRWE